MPRTSQQAVTRDETADQVSVENLVADGTVVEPSVAAPPEFDQAQLQQMISKTVSKVLVDQLLVLLPDMVASSIPGPHNRPSGTTTIQMIDDAPQKPGYLKHYRMDDVVSGKYQLIDVNKLDEDGEIPYVHTLQAAGHYTTHSPAVIKGKWIHFQNGHFYATTQQEVDYIEWRIRTDPQFRAYEDKNIAGDIICGVANCGKRFADQETLAAHMRATHGV